MENNNIPETSDTNSDFMNKFYPGVVFFYGGISGAFMPLPYFMGEDAG